VVHKLGCSSTISSGSLSLETLYAGSRGAAASSCEASLLLAMFVEPSDGAICQLLLLPLRPCRAAQGRWNLDLG
jgi:hypothetical protein